MLTEVFSVRVDPPTARGLEAAARAADLSTPEAHRKAIALFVAAIARTLEDDDAPRLGGGE